METNHFLKTKGAVLVELALMLPVLLLIVFGMFELGRAFYIKSALNNAAREGVRRASVSPTTPLDQDMLKGYVKSCIPFDKTGLVLNIAPDAPIHGKDAITVTVELPFYTAVPLLLTQLNGKLKGEASMLYE